MTGRAHIHLGIVENEILQMDEFAGNPHVGDGLEEIRPPGETPPNLRSGDTLVETRQRILCCRYRPEEGFEVQFPDFIRH